MSRAQAGIVAAAFVGGWCSTLAVLYWLGGLAALTGFIVGLIAILAVMLLWWLVFGLLMQWAGPKQRSRHTRGRHDEG